MSRGNIQTTVLATGTLEADNLVSVGAQTSGVVKAVGFAVGDTVMNERIDTFTPPGKARYGLPVAGVFVVKNGKITAWRDYFDVRQFTKGTGIEL